MRISFIGLLDENNEPTAETTTIQVVIGRMEGSVLLVKCFRDNEGPFLFVEGKKKYVEENHKGDGFLHYHNIGFLENDVWHIGESKYHSVEFQSWGNRF